MIGIINVIRNWYRGTRFFMLRNNKNNNVEILSDEQYMQLLIENKIKCNIIV